MVRASEKSLAEVRYYSGSPTSRHAGETQLLQSPKAPLTLEGGCGYWTSLPGGFTLGPETSRLSAGERHHLQSSKAPLILESGHNYWTSLPWVSGNFSVQLGNYTSHSSSKLLLLPLRVDTAMDVTSGRVSLGSQDILQLSGGNYTSYNAPPPPQTPLSLKGARSSCHH